MVGELGVEGISIVLGAPAVGAHVLGHPLIAGLRGLG